MSHDPTTGFCSVPTPEIKVNHIRYKDAVLELPGLFGRFQFPVLDSEITAQAGSFGDLTNHLSGTMTGWGEEVQVPNDEKGLDPDFDATKHRESFQCNLKTDPAKPVNYQCEHKKELVTHAARLLVLNTAMVVKESFAEKIPKLGSIDKCGFDSSLWNQWLGCNDSHRVISMTNCVIGYNHNRPELYEQDCAKEQLYTAGQATIVKGRLYVHESCSLFDLWDLRKRPDSIRIHLDSVNLKDFTAYYIPDGKSMPMGKLIIENGHLSAQINPIFEESNKSRGQFDVLTPTAIFEELNLSDAKTILWLNPHQTVESDFSISLVVNKTELFAQNGMFRGKENSLSGKIMADGELYVIEEKVPLNPTYDINSFKQSYACD